jgi:nucleotide-binding universal stress UspA family protein
MTVPVPSLVVGIASVSEPEPLLAAAVELAESVGATLHVVHAYEHPEASLREYSRDEAMARRFEEQYRKAMTAELEARVRELSQSPRIHCHAVAGAACETLCARAEALGAQLLIVGASHRGRLLRTFLGSSAERVIRASSVPVLVMREPIQRPLQRVILTTDLSDLSSAAHERGVGLIRSLFPQDRPELRSVLVVWHDLAVPSLLGQEALEMPAQQDLSAFLDDRPSYGFPSSRRVRVGNPAREIAAEARSFEPDLLVLGTHGRSGSSRFLLGSVAEATVRMTKGNVLVLPAAVAASRVQPSAEQTVPVPSAT